MWGMDWGTLVSTGLGALFGAGSTMTANLIMVGRQRGDRDRDVARQAYVEYLGAISRTTGQLNALRQDGSLTGEDRMREAGRILTESGIYESRQRVLIISPQLNDPTEEAFKAMRALRYRFKDPDLGLDAEWEELLGRITNTMDALRLAMHDSLK
jgi:hypothetical protein